MSTRYLANDLVSFAVALLRAAGMDAEKSLAVAEILVEGDLLGHTTHGLALLPLYLREIETGAMALVGSPRVMADFPAAITWDGMHLPGPWLTRNALNLAAERATKLGTCTIVIRRSHHIACLAAYLKPIADRGLMALLSCSAPSEAYVAPYGGTREVYSPNPIAAAWPTGGEPVILDVSMSITSVGMTRRARSEGRKLSGEWLLDANGNPTTDPTVLASEPRGTLLPLGGIDHGHKGYAMGLLVEALTGGLAGHGRADPPEGWSANVFVQLLDPKCFGGTEDFIRQMGWLSAACKTSPPRKSSAPVRLPGQSALRRRAEQLEGVELYPGIMEALEPWLKKLNVKLPSSK